MAVNISGDTGIDKITDGSVVADDLASTLDLSGKTITLATDAAVVSKLSTASGSAPSYSARAWVNFNGVGTVAIRGSGNVSSITDNGVGDYTVNFTTAMPDANYVYNINGDRGGSATVRYNTTSAVVSSSLRFQTRENQTPATDDEEFIRVAIFR